MGNLSTLCHVSLVEVSFPYICFRLILFSTAAVMWTTLRRLPCRPGECSTPFPQCDIDWSAPLDKHDTRHELGHFSRHCGERGGISGAPRLSYCAPSIISPSENNLRNCFASPISNGPVLFRRNKRALPLFYCWPFSCFHFEKLEMVVFLEADRLSASPCLSRLTFLVRILVIFIPVHWLTSTVVSLLIFLTLLPKDCHLLILEKLLRWFCIFGWCNVLCVYKCT